MTQANPFDVIRESDWVSGSSASDEKFIGYVESIDEGGQLLVWVTQSDHEPIVNTLLQASRVRTKKLPDRSLFSHEELRSLIDLALMTHDKQWFAELNKKLPAAPVSKPSSQHTPVIHPRWNNTSYRKSNGEAI
ncbi:IDEAL domain-containing protein [Paenibacillus sp. cl123]|nr:IDEAL domain-containing protein [Paenibacillus sp. cl123]